MRAFTRYMLKRRSYVRRQTYLTVLSQLHIAIELGEDDFDTILVRMRNLIPFRNKPPRRRTYKKRLTIRWHLYEREIEKRYPVTNGVDAHWWHDTGMELLPRYGAEMLGEDF